MKFLLIFILPQVLWAQTPIADAKKSIQSLIQPLMASNSNKRPSGTEKFRIDGCDQKKIDWMGILFMKESATLTYKFGPGCDIEGTITPKLFQSFPAKLKLRNIKSYSNLVTLNKITANLQAKPILNLEMTQGQLTGLKESLKFEADYSVQINPTAKNPVERNLGGELRILEINGKKSMIKEKIFVK
jgi:hypothetical protein